MKRILALLAFMAAFAFVFSSCKETLPKLLSFLHRTDTMSLLMMRQGVTRVKEKVWVACRRA